ncbi:hypothetical protein KUV28_19250 [Ferrimonas balearica]|nr:hypothetical protein [Ferrimonas balearica]
MSVDFLRNMALGVPSACRAIVRRGGDDEGIARALSDAGFLEALIMRGKKLSRGELNRLTPHREDEEHEPTPAQIEGVKLVANLAAGKW